MVSCGAVERRRRSAAGQSCARRGFPRARGRQALGAVGVFSQPREHRTTRTWRKGERRITMYSETGWSSCLILSSSLFLLFFFFFFSSAFSSSSSSSSSSGDFVKVTHYPVVVDDHSGQVFVQFNSQLRFPSVNALVRHFSQGVRCLRVWKKKKKKRGRERERERESETDLMSG